jgi:ATP phosphoribosyltransferase regulatory subunit
MEYTVKLHGTDEKVMYDLRALFEQYGYTQYKVSKFEEYDLYAQNRSFITGSNILTFTDTDGHLMALKPDVTLSIIRNTKLSKSLSKVYYNESVYRAPDPATGYREIQQTGLECIGHLDLYDICEIVMIAARSLALISSEYMLDLSHVALLSGFLTDCRVELSDAESILRLAEEKNAHEAELLCKGAGMEDKDIDTFKKLIHLRDKLSSAISALSGMSLGERAAAAVAELSDVANVLRHCGVSDNIYLDLTLQCDPNYYNGIVFKGFVSGIPSAVLSGGRYDGLVKKLGKDTGAMGFALYLNLLERMGERGNDYDVDVLLLKSDSDNVCDTLSVCEKLISQGETVRVDSSIPDNLKYKRIVRVSEEV